MHDGTEGLVGPESFGQEALLLKQRLHLRTNPQTETNVTRFVVQMWLCKERPHNSGAVRAGEHRGRPSENMVARALTPAGMSDVIHGAGTSLFSFLLLCSSSSQACRTGNQTDIKQHLDCAHQSQAAAQVVQPGHTHTHTPHAGDQLSVFVSSDSSELLLCFVLSSSASSLHPLNPETHTHTHRASIFSENH